MLSNRWIRLSATLLVTGLAAAYIVSKIDLGRTAHTLRTADEAREAGRKKLARRRNMRDEPAGGAALCSCWNFSKRPS